MEKLTNIQYRKALFWYCLLFAGFLLLANLFVYSQQKEGFTKEFNQSNETVINLLATLGKEALLAENYAMIEWFLQRWGEAHEDVVSIEMKNSKGLLIADYNKTNFDGDVVTIQKQVMLTDNHLFTMRMRVIDINIKQHLQTLILQLFVGSTLATILLALTIWLLLRRLAIIPLEQEVVRRHSLELKAQQQHSFLQSVIDGAKDSIMVISTDYEVLLMNNAAQHSSMENCVADLKHPKCYELLCHQSSPCSGDHNLCPFDKVVESKTHASALHRYQNTDGSYRYVELIASPLWNDDGTLRGVIEFSRDLTAHIQLQNELQINKKHLDHLAYYDPLTDLPNRILLTDRLSQAVIKASRNDQKLAILYIDLDNFKQINDSVGHAVGDEVLKIISVRLKESVREEDTVARLGGDEFTIILEEINTSNDAAIVAQNLIQLFQNPCHVNFDKYILTCSIGISIYPQDADNSVDLLRNADAAMFQAKERGRNTFQFYTQDMTVQAHERVLLENQLRHALAQEEFVVYYQPQFSCAANKIIGMEALVRWEHPDRGLVMPMEFIPLAEVSGLIIPLGEWVLQTACRQMSIWRNAGLEPGRVAVNLSGKQLQKKELLQTVLSILVETACHPEWLELEVTEGFIMDHPEESINTLKAIKALGIELAIDDFGTGYSSLAYLKRLPINRLKIDQSFVRDIPEDLDDMAITRAIIALGKSLNLKVIAEGVETETQQSFLRVEGCDEMQGYLYSRPIPTDEMTRMLEKPQ